MICKTRKLNYAEVKLEIEELCIINRFQNDNIVLKMKYLIPEYISNNSKYESFDKKIRNLNKRRELEESEKLNKA